MLRVVLSIWVRRSLALKRYVCGKRKWQAIEVNKKAYRGSFEVRISADGKTLDVVNVLPLEQYLYSVVGEEIPVISLMRQLSPGCSSKVAGL